MNENNTFPKWLFPAISWILGGYFFFVFHKICGFPLKVPTDEWSWVFLLLSVIFFLVPFAKRIKIGKYFEFEREIKSLKDNINDFKIETRQSLLLISSSVNMISNVQNININVPSTEEMRRAVEKSDLIFERIETPRVHDAEREIRLDYEDNIMALARTRILLEQLLRKILGKKLKAKRFHGVEVKFLSARNLFKIFINKYPEYAKAQEVFDNVINICNAAIHGQSVPEAVASAALETGSRIIATLRNIAGEE